MIFLNPAVLFGLLAASIPVLIHLLNRRKLKRIDFSTLTFLKELQKNKIRKIKIKQILLLALRVLIILFLVGAFARPTLEGISIGGASSAAKTTAVFILDNTFSMSVVDNNGSYLNQAKETIKKLLGELQEGDEAALILVSGFKNEEIKPTNNLADFSKKVDEAAIGYYSGTLNDAITKAAKILSESKNFNKEIYLLSDFQKGRLSNENSYSDLGDVLNDKVKLYSFNYSGKDIFNIGIDKIKINDQIFEKNKPVSFNVTVTNYSDKPAENVVVSLFVNNKRSAQQSTNLNPGESKIITIESVIEDDGYINIFAEIEDDDILQDNKRYTNLFIPNKIPIIIFSENAQDSKFINLALTSSNDNNSIEVTNKNINQISAVDLNQYDAAIIIGDKINNPDRIKSFVKNGGGLFFMPGEKTSLKDFQEAEKELNLPQPTSESGKTSDVNNSVFFEKIDFNHPIFQNIFSNEKNKIESPEIYHHFKIETKGNGKNIISLIDGSSFLSEYKEKKGKIFLLNTAPVLSWGNFPLKSIFVPLIYKSVFYLASKNRDVTNYLTGNEVTVDVSNRSLPQIKIDLPDKTDEFFNMEELNNSNYITFNNTIMPGNFKVFSGVKIIDDFSVNVDPRESVTKYLSNNEFKDYLKKINFKGHYIEVNKDENPVEIILQSRFGSELWKYFLLIAIILALVEMTIARNTKKEITGIQ